MLWHPSLQLCLPSRALRGQPEKPIVKLITAFRFAFGGLQGLKDGSQCERETFVCQIILDPCSCNGFRIVFVSAVSNFLLQSIDAKFSSKLHLSLHSH